MSQKTRQNQSKKNSLRSWTVHLLKLTVSLAMLIGVLYHANFSEILQNLKETTVASFILASGCVAIGVIGIQSIEIEKSIKNNRVKLYSIIKTNNALFFYSLFLPTAITFYIRWNKYRKLGIDGLDSAALIGFHKLLQTSIAAAVAVICFFWLPSPDVAEYNKVYEYFFAGCAIILILFIPVFFIKTKPKEAEGIFLKLLKALSSFNSLSLNSKCFVFFAALLQHILIVTSAWIILYSLDPGTSFIAVALIRSVLAIILLFPISVGGIGARELIFFIIFPLYGVNAEIALAGSLTLFAVQLFISCFGAWQEAHSLIKKVELGK